MAIALSSKTNVTSPTVAYPYGNIKDDTGVGDGTPVNVQVYGDFHQFFARLLAIAGITANNQPDNLTNGFQYVDSLMKVIGANSWTNPGLPVIPNDFTFSPSDVRYNRYRLVGKTLFWQLNIAGGTVNTGVGELVVKLPTAVASNTFDNNLHPHLGFYTVGSGVNKAMIVLTSISEGGVVLRTLDGSDFIDGSSTDLAIYFSIVVPFI